jgi:hypothetical protein
MNNLRLMRVATGAALILAAALGGCSDNQDRGAVPPAAAPQAMFSAFVTQAFAADANANPVSVDVTLNYDVDNDPTAFNGLLM